MNLVDSFVSRIVPPLNIPRKHVSQYHISHLYKKCVGMIFMHCRKSYDVMIMITFIPKLCSRMSKEASVGEFVGGSYIIFYTTNKYPKRGKLTINTSHMLLLLTYFHLYCQSVILQESYANNRNIK